jgi:hypothetical protein
VTTHTWIGVLGVESEAIVGRPEALEVMAEQLRRLVEAYEDVVLALRAATGNGAAGRSGLAADAFAALTDGISSDVALVPQLLGSALQAITEHADRLHDLRGRADEELELAARRRLRLQQADEALARAIRIERAAEVDRLIAGDVLGGDPSCVGVVGEAERERQRRAAALDRSRDAHRELRESEVFLVDRSTRRIDDVVLPTRDRVEAWASLLSATAVALLARGPVATWRTLHGVMVDAGIDVESPLGIGRRVDCVEVGDDGTVILHVDGPQGGALVVGEDLSPDVFEVAVALLGGRLPDFRPFTRLADLPIDEFSALNWAYGANFAFGEAAQLQLGGVNGSWESYQDGGSWAPQELRPVDALGMAMAMATPNTLRGHIGGGSVQQAAGSLLPADRACAPTYRSERSSPRGRRATPVQAGDDR